MELSLAQRMLIVLLREYGISSDLTVTSLHYLDDSQLMDFFWWMEHQMNELGRFLKMEEILGEISVRTFEAINNKKPATTNDQYYG